jgi:nitrogen-specific signal transduction histidine kinase
MAAVTDDFEIVYANDSFLRYAGLRDRESLDRDIRRVAENWQMQDVQSQPLTFENSPLAAVTEQGRPRICYVSVPGSSRSMIAQTAPMDVDGTIIYLCCLAELPVPDRSSSTEIDTNNFELLSLVHDIRAPLIAIEAFARRLRDKYADHLDDDGTFVVANIMENGKILHQMIDGLNTLSRNRTDDEPFQDIYLKELVKELAQELKAAYPGTHYRIKYSGGLPSIRAPKRKLTTLFRNILDNAFKYTATISEPAIEITYALDGGRHRFQISDNGPGIDPDYAQKIFAPFFRAPEAFMIQGSGIGLALARDIINAWGGAMWVEKPEQQGMRIAFTLPPEIPR